jgi:hypothetical protein
VNNGIWNYNSDIIFIDLLILGFHDGSLFLMIPLWVFVPCGCRHCCRRFGGTCYLHVQRQVFEYEWVWSSRSTGGRIGANGPLKRDPLITSPCTFSVLARTGRQPTQPHMGLLNQKLYTVLVRIKAESFFFLEKGV